MATLVCFHAHPDDESIATGGTMALAAEAGHRVVLVLGTRGEQGEPVPGVLAEGEALWERRVVETHRAAEILGVERVEFLGYEDSGMMGEPTNENPACFWQADVEEAAERLAAILRDRSTPTCSRSTTTTAATATPTTSRSTGSGAGPPSWPASTTSTSRR